MLVEPNEDVLKFQDIYLYRMNREQTVTTHCSGGFRKM